MRVTSGKITEERVSGLFARCLEDPTEKGLETALELYPFAIEHLPKCKSIYTNMIQILINNEEMGQVLDIYQDMQAQGLEVDIGVYNAMLVGFIKEGNIHKVEQIDEALTALQIKRNEENYDILITTFIQDGNILKAQNLFHEFRKESDLKRDLNIYGKMISAYCLRSNVEEALRMIKMLEAEGLRSDLALYNQVIVSCVRPQNYSLIWHCFILMRERNIIPSIVSWNALIECLCRADKLDEAMAHFRQLETKHHLPPNADTYSSVIQAHVRKKYVQESEDLFIEMRNKQHHISPKTWKAIIEVFARSNQLDKAFILVDQMLEEKSEPTSQLLHILQSKCHRRGKIQWYIDRFGEPAQRGTTLDEATQAKLLKKYAPINYEWDVGEGSPLPVLEPVRKIQEQRENERKRQMDKLEEQFMLTIPPEIREKMEQKQAALAKKRKEKSSLPKSSEVSKKSRLVKKLPKKKAVKAPKPDPFTAMEMAQKRKKKWLTTPKDTRQPRSQTYWGRHRGPKIK